MRSVAWATSRAWGAHTVMYALRVLLTAAMRWSTASVSSTGDNSRRSRRGAASAIVRFSRSACAISRLLALRKARDRRHAPPGAFGDLPVQLVGGRDQPRERGDELVPARGRQRQVGEDTQALDGLLRHGRVLFHPLLLLAAVPGSDAEILGDDAGVAEAVRPQLLGDLPLQHRVRAVGELAGEVEVLLDEDHGHPEARVDADQLAQDLVHDGRLDPLGRLVQQQDLRVADERPGDREDLLLAAGQAPAP